VLDRLLPLLRRHDDRSFLERIQNSMREWRRAQEQLETSDERPMKPQRLAAEVGRRLREDAIVSADSGTVTAWWARHISARRGQMHSVSGMMASMGCALPYAIAAQIAYPDRQCIAFVGDGGMAMLMGEFATAVKYQLPIKVFVVRNHSLAQIKWEQLMFLGNPEYGCELHDIDFAAFARACGGVGLSARTPDRIGDLVGEALATAGPVILEADVDPLEAPMFANLREEQAKKLREAIARGQSDADGILENARKERGRELV
jgi:pyruvate dehydrogenase (quinone)/pyruvate oxidase